jgi:hypothetical protein
MRLYAVTGQMLLSRNDLDDNTAEIDLAGLPAGIYMLCVNGRSFVKIEIAQ